MKDLLLFTLNICPIYHSFRYTIKHRIYSLRFIVELLHILYTWKYLYK